jgi:multicomponent Na+:H+ antiporter subunit B
MMNKLSRWWGCVCDFVEGAEPERTESEVTHVADTHRIEARARADAAKTRPVRYHNKTFAERFSEWEHRHAVAVFGWIYNVTAVVFCVVIAAILIVTVSYLPPFGEVSNPANNEVVDKYIRDTLSDTGATNVVAGIILDYRAFDTLGESCVLFLASCAVMILLRLDGESGGEDEEGGLYVEMNEPRHDGILAKISSLVVPVVMVFGVYVVLNGHLSPGGGFSGGTILGGSLILFLSAFGTEKTSQFFTQRVYNAITILSLSFYTLAKGFSFFTGANHIETHIPLGTPGAILSAGFILPLNICVGMVVACTVYGFYTLFSKGEI